MYAPIKKKTPAELNCRNSLPCTHLRTMSKTISSSICNASTSHSILGIRLSSTLHRSTPGLAYTTLAACCRVNPRVSCSHSTCESRSRVLRQFCFRPGGHHTGLLSPHDNGKLSLDPRDAGELLLSACPIVFAGNISRGGNSIQLEDASLTPCIHAYPCSRARSTYSFSR